MVEPTKCKEELDHSRIFNVHRWSEYPEVNLFVNEIYDNYFSDLTKLRKHHLKVLLLDLYVLWYEDPTMCLAIHMNKNRYKKGSRYSALNLSPRTILVVKRLIADGFLYFHKGINYGDYKRTARIWPTEKLIELFYKANFNVLCISLAPHAETIILRDEDKNNIEYEDTDETNQMREVLIAYNDLLQASYIDVANINQPYIKRKQKKGSNQPSRISVNQSRKFVYRVFNESFDRGGRAYGGFWQSIPKEHRQHIRINDERVIEIDFSGWHIQLLYARKNINYFDKYGSKADPYDVHVPEINDPTYKRWLLKNIMLVSVNAENEKKTINAIKTMPTDEVVTKPNGFKLTEKLIKNILQKLKEKHSDIADFFCTGAGIQLQNIDGKIANNLIKTFTKEKVPLLSVHDSYLVAEQHNSWLFSEMLKEYKAVGLMGKHIGGTGLAGLETDLAYTKVKQLGYVDEELDLEEPDGGEKHQAMVRLKDKHLIETPAYKRRYKTWFDWTYPKVA